MVILMKSSTFGEKIFKIVNFRAEKYANFGTIILVNKFKDTVFILGC